MAEIAQITHHSSLSGSVPPIRDCKLIKQCGIPLTAKDLQKNGSSLRHSSLAETLYKPVQTFIFSVYAYSHIYHYF